MLVRILLPTPRLLSVRLDSDLATRLSQELACLRGPPASILWNRACPPKSLSPLALGERWGVSKWGWVGLALELKVGVAFGEGSVPSCYCPVAQKSEKICAFWGKLIPSSFCPYLLVGILDQVSSSSLSYPRQSHRHEKHSSRAPSPSRVGVGAICVGTRSPIWATGPVGPWVALRLLVLKITGLICITLGRTCASCLPFPLLFSCLSAPACPLLAECQRSSSCIPAHCHLVVAPPFWEELFRPKTWL